MEQLLEKIGSLGVNIDTQSLVEIARYWFWKDIICDAMRFISITIVMGGLFLGIFIAIKNFSTGKWKIK